MTTIEYIITAGIPTLAVAIVGYILVKQIASQKEMLENYKSYIEATDWKKVKDHYENFVMPSEMAKAEKAFNEEIEEGVKYLEPEIDKMMKQYTEALLFAVHVSLTYLNKETGQRLVKEKMPMSERYFEGVWAWHDRQNADIERKD